MHELFHFQRLGAHKILTAATLCVAALGGAASAQTVTSHDAQGHPGGLAAASFDINFGASTTNWSTYDLTVSFDPTLLSYTSGDLGAITPTVGSTFFDGVGTGSYSATWYALDSSFNPLPALSLSGVTTLKFTFQLASGFTPPAGTQVHLEIHPGDESLNALPALQGVATIQSTAAVPEVDAAWLAVTGLLMVTGSMAVRRGRRGGDSPSQTRG